MSSNELRDPKLGTSPWAGEFDVYHEPPTLTLLPGSQIKDGQKLRVSYYHAVTIYDNQVPCSLDGTRRSAASMVAAQYVSLETLMSTLQGVRRVLQVTDV